MEFVPIMRPIGLGLGGLLLALALFHTLSATIGRGNWVRPTARLAARVLGSLAGFFKTWSMGAVSSIGAIEHELAWVLSIFFGIALLLPCVGALALVCLLSPTIGPAGTLDLLAELWDSLEAFFSRHKAIGVFGVLFGLLAAYAAASVHNVRLQPASRFSNRCPPAASCNSYSFRS